jgi:predicted glycosyltransferase
MRHASLSISQAGYNTLTDVFAAGAAAVVIPFAESGEIEQSLRAQRLQACGRVVMLEQTQLSAQNLAAAIDRAIDLDASMPLNLNGADNSADRIAAWLRAAQT